MSAYQLYRKPGNSGENSNGRFIPVECFRKKGNTFRGIPFSPFFRNSRKFLYHLSTITSARLFPRGQQCPLSDESLLFQTVRDVTVVLFSRLLSTDFLQHNCSAQGEKDLSFGRRFLCFTFAFMIRAFELNGAGKHLHPKLRIK